MSLPTKVIRDDHRLEGEASSASEHLARHRWHWTLDPENPARVSIREYARAVGRGSETIRTMVNGYEAWLEADRGPRSLNDHMTLAGMSTERQAVTNAISNARGVSVDRVERVRAPEVRRVREIARDRAEKRGTTVEEEAHKVADWIVKAEKATKAQKEEKAQRHTLRFIAVEAHLAKAMRALTEALNESHHVDWGEGERELLQEVIEKVKALLGLVDISLVGAADVDWDAELARIADGAE